MACQKLINNYSDLCSHLVSLQTDKKPNIGLALFADGSGAIFRTSRLLPCITYGYQSGNRVADFTSFRKYNDGKFNLCLGTIQRWLRQYGAHMLLYSNGDIALYKTCNDEDAIKHTSHSIWQYIEETFKLSNLEDTTMYIKRWDSVSCFLDAPVLITETT